MFDPNNGKPRVFALSPGVDFPAALVAGLQELMAGHAPHDMARVELFVNTARMRRRIQELFSRGGASFLPKLRLVTDLGENEVFADLPDTANPLARRLEIAQLVRKLIEREPDIAARAHTFDLADSLASLMEEMQSEGVHPDALAQLDVADHSAHWARSQKFLELVTHFFATDAPLNAEARQRIVVSRLIKRWEVSPPEHPVIIAGSTGSRGTTRLLMEAVARLPQGALILPGFDTIMPEKVWDQLDDEMTSEDHPQYRFHALLRALDIPADKVPLWITTAPAQADRNALVSLALRPAPVTDDWLLEGPDLENLAAATEAVTLIEAPTARAEALAISLRLRKAAEDGQSAALISPDRTLTRQVTAALQRWGIEPDDSAGIPLPQTPSGRILRQTADLMGRKLPSDKLLALLKHPLVAREDRGDHLKRTRDLELKLLRGGPPFPTRREVEVWAAKRESDTETHVWVSWLWDILDALASCASAPLPDLLEQHIALTEKLCAGPGKSDAGTLWNKPSGEEAAKAVSNLREAAAAGGEMACADYSDLMHFVLNQHEVRDPNAPHAGIMIWGTLEARVQGADLVILAGLNDGIWPELPGPDPWLNRQMRRDAGLLLPDRRIGLSAHDFQQAIAAPEVWLTRSKRDAEAETVQSRWINRLTNLLNGLDGSGAPALKAMRERGDDWVKLAMTLDLPRDQVMPAQRPSPVPPVHARPKSLPVTQIETLIRDPYAVYARYVLRLRPLDPLHATADAPLRGLALHDVLERFIKDTATHLPDDAVQLLTDLADEVFATTVPWPATRAMWKAKLARVAPWFVDTEHTRRQYARPLRQEEKGAVALDGIDFTLEGRADRIDEATDGALFLYDYKTGSLPTKPQREHFNKQLPLLAAIADRGGFKGLTGRKVIGADYLGLGSDPNQEGDRFEFGDLDKVWDELVALISAYLDPDKGFSSRRAVFEARWEQNYDHLARFGEWDETDDAVRMEVGQ
ncbi:double-strand break repair protein AddB [Litoreibacter janthinus]|uniref:Double-strand break repair protein AddB n=1 Tax=Litoreibacter janthinus TaxID=670154 RepID=A0A1I6FWB0_9RHOB|nr:double-strand break repair protein AddB [Litoreibacter janthinus]SFR34210.1 double-strand break repair protein AddB [Litoreibacter janthinus]